MINKTKMKKIIWWITFIVVAYFTTMMIALWINKNTEDKDCMIHYIQDGAITWSVYEFWENQWHIESWRPEYLEQYYKGSATWCKIDIDNTLVKHLNQSYCQVARFIIK